MKKKNQKSCDKLLSPIIVKLYPRCLLCNGQTQVAHHHCHKSKSLTLRYDFKNLIPLCNSCHFKLHFNESFWASKIVKIKGLKWFSYIEKKKQETLRYPDYDTIYAKLDKMLG